MNILKKAWNYILVCKVRETILLTFIGLASFIVGSNGHPDIGRMLFATATVLVASAGANGVTNYLDRDLDAKMERTKKRVFPTKRIDPAEKALPWLIFLVLAGLVMAWFVRPYAFFADLIGSTAAFVYRKRNTCVFPQGAIASFAPVLIGWWGATDAINWQIGIICLMIMFWLPLHVWTVMISRRDEYLGAGCTFFPLKTDPKYAIYILFVCALALIGLGVAYYFVAEAGLVFLISAIVLDLVLLVACVVLKFHYSNSKAWKLYKLSSFPYLGILFMMMCIDLWV